MRTTVDLPDALHKQLVSIARDSSRSLSQTVTDLIERGLTPEHRQELTRSAATGLPLVTLGRFITTEDVRALEDDH